MIERTMGKCDILRWAWSKREHGKGHLTRMNAVLRAYVDAHKRSA